MFRNLEGNSNQQLGYKVFYTILAFHFHVAIHHLNDYSNFNTLYNLKKDLLSANQNAVYQPSTQ